MPASRDQPTERRKRSDHKLTASNRIFFSLALKQTSSLFVYSVPRIPTSRQFPAARTRGTRDEREIEIEIPCSDRVFVALLVSVLSFASFDLGSWVSISSPPPPPDLWGIWLLLLGFRDDRRPPILALNWSLSEGCGRVSVEFGLGSVEFGSFLRVRGGVR